MSSWKEVVIGPETTLGEAIARVDASRLQVAVVVNEEGKLIGVLTDGDIRRAILRGQGLDSPVHQAMNRNATSVSAGATRDEMLALMRRKVIRHLPVLDPADRLIGLVTLDALIGAVQRPNWVVLMAGGLGTRLQPLTHERPKPLLPVGGKPMIEAILESFAEQGFRHIFLCVNYKAEMIREHVGNGERWGVQIEYLHEPSRLGTAGGLRLLAKRPEHPVIVMNGDVLTRISFDNLLRFHEDQSAVATMVVRDYQLQVPYGVVRLEGGQIRAIEEKPVHAFLVNAGIYVLSPEAFDYLPACEPADMPDLFQGIVRAGKLAAAFPLREYWIDVGRMDELERANREWDSSRR